MIDVDIVQAKKLLSKFGIIWATRSNYLILSALQYNEAHAGSAIFTVEVLLKSPFLLPNSEAARAARKNIIPAISNLRDKGILRQVQNGYATTNSVKELKDLTSVFSTSTRRLIIWYIWNLHSNGVKNFPLSILKRLLWATGGRWVHRTASLHNGIAINQILQSIGISIEGDNCKILPKAAAEAETAILYAIWPSYAIAHIEGSPVRLSSRHIKVDIPNNLFSEFIEKLMSLYELQGMNGYELHTKCREIEKQTNTEISDYLRDLVHDKSKHYKPWFKIYVSKNIKRADKAVQVAYRVNWKGFNDFQKQLVERDITLSEKYEYLVRCRGRLGSVLNSRSYLPEIQDKIKKASASEMKNIDKSMNELVSLLINYNGALGRNKHAFYMLTLEYIPELINTTKALAVLAKNGAISSCYREMRKMIENLAWVLLDDILLMEMSSKDSAIPESFAPFLRVCMGSRDWFEWASRQRLIIRNLGDLKARLPQIADKDDIAKVIIKNITYPVLILLSTKGKKGSNTPVSVPEYDKDLFETARGDLQTCLIQEGLGNKENIDAINHFIDGLELPAVCGYPSNQMVIDLFDSKISSETGFKASSLYDEYSLFIHSYFSSWSIFPFSSILEFKIFASEFDRFVRFILTSLEYLTRLDESIF